MDIIMIREEPLFRKCCFFIPLRLCLQTWACIKLVADVLAVSYLFLVIAFLYSNAHDEVFNKLSMIHLLAVIFAALLVDVGFLITLIVGIFKKSSAILRLFYFYELYVITAETVLIAVIGMTLIEGNISSVFFYIFIGVLYIFLDVCICLTVKSEMIKLRNKDQYDFSRMPVTEADVEGTGKFKAEEE